MYIINITLSAEHFVLILSASSSSGQFTVKTESYFVSEGPGSLLNFGGACLDWSLFRDTQLDPGDSDLSSSFSTGTLIFWSEVGLRGETVTLTVSSEQESGNKFVHQSHAGLEVTHSHAV